MATGIHYGFASSSGACPYESTANGGYSYRTWKEQRRRSVEGVAAKKPQVHLWIFLPSSKALAEGQETEDTILLYERCAKFLKGFERRRDERDRDCGGKPCTTVTEFLGPGLLKCMILIRSHREGGKHHSSSSRRREKYELERRNMGGRSFQRIWLHELKVRL